MKTPNYTIACILTCCCFLNGCEKRTEKVEAEGTNTAVSNEQPNDDEEADTSKLREPSWKDRLRSSDLLKSGKDKAAQYARDAKSKLGDFSVKGFKQEVLDLKTSIEKNDYASAQTAGDKLASLLDSRAISDCVRFFKIKSEKGAVAAREAIDEHLEAVEMAAEYRKVFEYMGDNIASMGAEDTIDVIALIVAYSCENKFPHGGAVVGIVLGEVLKEVFNVERKERKEAEIKSAQ